MRSVLRNFMCGVGWDKKKHFPISRSTLPRCYMLLCTMTLQITTYIGTYIHSNLVFHGNKYRALFTVCSLHNFRQISEVEIEFWTVLTYWHWFIKTGWIWRFVFFHFDDIWWSCCKQTPELPELGSKRQLIGIFGKHLSDFDDVCLKTQKSVSFQFDKSEHQNKNGSRKIPYKIKWQ